MSYSETIDNINTRIENIISNRLPQTYQHITIEPSKYNPTIDENITVTITVKDQSDNPISGFTVPLKINGESITGLSTNNNGQVIYNYTCDEWGITKFDVNSYTAFIQVTGWKTHMDTGENSNPRWIVEYNETTTRVILAFNGTQTIPASATDYGTEIIDNNSWYLRPATSVMFPVYNGAMVVIAGPSLSHMQRRTIYGTAQFTAQSQYWQVEWTHQGLR